MKVRQLFTHIPVVALQAGATAVLMAVLSGCSLVSIESAAEPLTRKEMNARILTHDFAMRFASAVELAADSVFSTAKDFPIRLNALRWKIGAYSAIREAALRESPTVAMIGTWALCIQMEEFFRIGPGDSLFGKMQGVAVDVSQKLETEIDSLIRSFATPAEYKRVSDFVRHYVDRFPFQELTFKQEPIIRSWNRYEGLPDSAAVKTVGDLPQAVADLASRINIQSGHLPKETLWQIQLLIAEAGLSGPEAEAALDSLQVEIRKIGQLAEASPELLDSTLLRLSRDLEVLLLSVDRQRKETLDVLSGEREAISALVQHERVAIMEQLEGFSQVTIEKTYGMLQELVNSILLYGIILAILVLTVPFAMGYVVGKTVGRQRRAGRDVG